MAFIDIAFNRPVWLPRAGRVKKLVLWLFILAVLLVLVTAGVGACTYWYFERYTAVHGSVDVEDQAGNPVADVEVWAISPSIGSRAGVTDSQGKASFYLSRMMPEAKWISLKKPGYDPVSVEVPSRWPLYITLAPAGTASRGVQLTPRP